MTALRNSTAGEFDPRLELADLSRQLLCRLGREFLLIGHLQDRVGLPLVMQRFGGDAFEPISIDEWMSASPIYSKRLQRALGFEGDDVSTVFKGIQMEIGSPPQFMDFRFRLDAPDSGEFWLPHCGALLDVEPFGEERVVAMCHHIEDPTFDATAAATNPRMKMRPIHRPPRVPADRMPHCRWRVFLDDTAAAAEPHPNVALLGATKLAAIELALPDADGEPGGWPDYSGAFDPDFQLEDLSHRALQAVAQEAAVQAHLLARSFLLCVAQRHGEQAAREIGRGQWTGVAALAALRLREALGIEGGGIDAIAKVFQLHPHFLPRTYVDLRLERSGPDRLHVSFGDCAAFAEADTLSWLGGLEAAPHPALEAIATAVDPRARCRPAEPRGTAHLAWDVVIDEDAEPAPEPKELALARLSRGASFVWESRRPLRG